MAPMDPKITELEHTNLDVHVTASHYRYEQLDQSIHRVEKTVEKLAVDTKEQLGELKKVILWASSTIFATLLITMLTAVFKVL